MEPLSSRLLHRIHVECIHRPRYLVDLLYDLAQLAVPLLQAAWSELLLVEVMLAMETLEVTVEVATEASEQVQV